MHLAPMIHLIEASDAVLFREVVLLTLKARGYPEAHLTDGPYDGGRDVKILASAAEGDALVVQISVEKNWRSKVRDDARKAFDRHFKRMDFYTSCRIPDGSRVAVQDELRRTFTGLAVEFFDSQAIASVIWTGGWDARLREVLGLEPVSSRDRRVGRPDLRQEVAFACAFFGTDTRAFREAVLENALLVAVERCGEPAAAQDALTEVALELRLGLGQQEQLKAALDRLRQRGELVGRNGHITLGEGVASRITGASAWAAMSELGLRSELESCLSKELTGSKLIQRGVEALMACVKAILATIPQGPLSALGAADRSMTVDLRRRYEDLLQTITALGVQPQRSQALLVEVTVILERSDFGRLIAAGEVFLQLNRLGMPQLVVALGGHGRMEIVLDASVAMPMLCALRHKLPGALRFFRAAMTLWDRCVEHQIAPVLPRPYLEEIASHLISAWRDYRQLVGEDPDLAASENAFVAHFAALQHTGELQESFEEYLEDFGLDQRIASADIARARDALMMRLQRRFSEYRIEVKEVHAGPLAQRHAQELLTWTLSAAGEGGKPRAKPEVLVRHDTQVLAALIDEGTSKDTVWVLCTWDSTMLKLRGLPPSTPILDPLSLADLLGLVAGENEEIRLSSPSVIALAMGSEVVERGARVLDQLVRMERGQLTDAAVTRQILSFKKDFLAHARPDAGAVQVRQEWARWRLRTLGGARVEGPDDEGNLDLETS